jgi:hypothetical protein
MEAKPYDDETIVAIATQIRMEARRQLYDYVHHVLRMVGIQVQDWTIRAMIGSNIIVFATTYLHNSLVATFGILPAPLIACLSLSLSAVQTHAVSVHVSVLNPLREHSRNEARRLPGLRNLIVKLINLLERKPFRLVDHCPDEEDTDQAASAPDEKYFSANVSVPRA